ncbi:hypothetical protein AMR53_11525 [Thermococcus thioreducens]|uniref:Uncharacterized protein n=1 Tax=Thermococcus thioreducens TaxID=277988 RepID=A0A0Q2RBU2_9EURY|nr:hypothetical protein AMR53_11525 [Thermococcus thioreducens]
MELVKGPTLTPSGTIQLEIKLDDNFANYYFGERPWDPIDRVFSSYKDRLAGYTYKVKFIFDDNVTAEDLIMVKDRGIMDEVKNFYNDFKDNIDAGNYAAAMYIFLKGGEKLGKQGAKRAGGLLTAALLVLDIHDWLFGPKPNTGTDNNDVVGG